MLIPARFPLGRVVATRTALGVLDADDIHQCIARHASGDWGDLCPEDRAANEAALCDGSRLLSAYEDRHKTKFWIITEADRSATTVLLPSDY